MDSLPADRRSPARVTITVIGLVLLTALALILVYQTRRVLTWIVVAAFLATALHPAVTWIERRARWLRRWLATLLVFLVVFAMLVGLVVLFVVPLVHEGSRLLRQLPELAEEVRQGRGPIGALVQRYQLRDYAAAHEQQIQAFVRRLGTSTLALVQGAFTTIAGTATVLVLAYLMVLEAPRILHGIPAVLGQERAARIRRIGAGCARTITGYVTGNLLISVICGLLTYLILIILGVPYAGLISLFVAIADLIPLVGATLGAILASLVAFTQSIIAGIVVVLFFIVYQQVENHLLQPFVLSRTVALNPLVVLVAILIGVELAGILGALLAIPVTGMIQVIGRDVWRQRRGGV